MWGHGVVLVGAPRGEAAYRERMRAILLRLRRLEEHAPRLMTLIFFLYGALLPFSNDVLVIPSGMLGYRYWRVLGPLCIGTAVFNIGIALLAANAPSLVAWFV